jgi:hypothetical protein
MRSNDAEQMRRLALYLSQDVTIQPVLTAVVNSLSSVGIAYVKGNMEPDSSTESSASHELPTAKATSGQFATRIASRGAGRNW